MFNISDLKCSDIFYCIECLPDKDNLNMLVPITYKVSYKSKSNNQIYAKEINPNKTKNRILKRIFREKYLSNGKKVIYGKGLTYSINGSSYYHDYPFTEEYNISLDKEKIIKENIKYLKDTLKLEESSVLENCVKYLEDCLND
jgi:hypothetical protein